MRPDGRQRTPRLNGSTGCPRRSAGGVQVERLRLHERCLLRLGEFTGGREPHVHEVENLLRRLVIFYKRVIESR